MDRKRLKSIPGFAIDKVAEAAADDPEILRLENLDTDLPPPASAVAATRAAVGLDEWNSYLPFTGDRGLRRAIADRLATLTGHNYDPGEVIVTCGGTEATLDVLLALADPGSEVILTDPAYAGTINRVRLVGAVPRLVPFVLIGGEWRLDLEALDQTVNANTAALLLMSPSMPSGAVLNLSEWEHIARICRDRSIWLVYIAAMERILYDGRPYIHPASLSGMNELTITLGSVSKEYCMIGWRIGWVVAPSGIAEEIARAHIYNVVTPPGFAQSGARAALEEPEGALAERVREWQDRRDVIVSEMRGLPLISAAGGWSMLLDVGEMGHDSFSASRLLLERGKVAATPMRDWGERNADQFVRLVFSNEPVRRLEGIRDRVMRALS